MEIMEVTRPGFDHRGLEIRKKAIEIIRCLDGMSIEDARGALVDAQIWIGHLMKVTVDNRGLQDMIQNAADWEKMLLNRTNQ